MSTQHKKRTTVQTSEAVKKPSSGSGQSSVKIEDSQKIKAEIIALREKISHQILSNPEAVKKASFILSQWINKKSR